jgi:hypothetical protein
MRLPFGDRPIFLPFHKRSQNAVMIAAYASRSRKNNDVPSSAKRSMLMSMNDADLLRQFEDRTLPFDRWTHRAHVRVAFCYLRQYAFDEALTRIRAGIQAYNAANKVPDGPTSGYNETTTVAFLRLIDATMRAYGGAMPTADSDAFCDTHPQLLHREVLRLFYSPQRRMHPAAKETFIEPDLTELPEVP